MPKDSTYLHYGAEASLFSGKTRAYLRFKGINFIEEKASVRVLKHVLYPKTGVKVIPVLKTPQDEFVQDTTQIIDFMEARYPEHSVYPDNQCIKLAALLLELYADEWLLLPAMHYRWHYKRQNLWFILKEFGANAVPHWPKLVQPFYGVLPALYFGRLYGPVLGIGKDNIHELERWYASFLDSLDKHLAEHSFLLGESPCIADFGFIGPLYAHLYRDPYPHKLMNQRAPNVVKWVKRMNNLSPDDSRKGFLDEIPDSLDEIFKHMFKTQFPVLKETVARVASRVLTHSNKRLPRFLGKTNFSLGTVEQSRYVNSYAQWMLQRPLACYEEMESTDRRYIQNWLAQLKFEGVLDITIPVKLKREQNQLFPDP